MIVDTSALVAILQNEPEALAIAETLAKVSHNYIAAPTYLETCMVYSGKREPNTWREVDALLKASKTEIIGFSSEAAALAVQAFLTYGKGRGHPAQLNFGDCISYAVSKLEGLPLLFKGEDFRHTDVEVAN